jgi:hypothetical protein
MKVCDKHQDRRAVDTIHILQDDTRIDVCDECKYQVAEMLSAPVLEKRRGRPPKNLAQAN